MCCTVLLTLRTHTEHEHTVQNSTCTTAHELMVHGMVQPEIRNQNASQGCQCLHYFTPKY